MSGLICPTPIRYFKLYLEGGYVMYYYVSLRHSYKNTRYVL